MILNHIFTILCFFFVLVPAVHANGYGQRHDDIEKPYFVFQDIQKYGVPVIKFYDNKDFKGDAVYELNDTGFWRGTSLCSPWSDKIGKTYPKVNIAKWQEFGIGVIFTEIGQKCLPLEDGYDKRSTRFVFNDDDGGGSIYLRTATITPSYAEIPRNSTDAGPPLYVNAKELSHYTISPSIKDSLGKKLDVYNDFIKTIKACIHKKDRGCTTRYLDKHLRLITINAISRTPKAKICNYDEFYKNTLSANQFLDCVFKDKYLQREFEDCFNLDVPKYPTRYSLYSNDMLCSFKYEAGEFKIIEFTRK